ncbi:DUF192 domain-containing protein [Leptospira semungkisensis]|uniref:DUF192 domain-containing protein n=1 Tax=Leptospira semungkisensis TaxID=2484985 RepID=A0A4V3JC50_9LEPT|nr:DUF192 domain-containing protein [Leptospira semungkisensis]TGK04759.1 DUF192 domain-containing protein [Leptospira semungkisensis]
MKSLRLSLLLAFFLLPWAGWGEYNSPLYLDKTTIYVGEHPLYVEVANTEESRQRGLMFRKKLGENEGMLFIFPSEDHLTFWMKNTLIPLSIGYFNKDKRMTDTFEMLPNQTKTLYHSSERVMYAVEANKGWFAKHNLGKFAVLKVESRFVGK